MPRVHFVEKARKDNPVAKKGEPYYWWKFRFGGKRYSRTRPRQSQLTRSEFLGGLLGAEEDFQDALAKAKSVEDVQAACQEAGETVRELGEMCDERYSAMEDAFPNGCPTMELLGERRDACECLADELETAAEEEPEPLTVAGEEETETESFETWKDEMESRFDWAIE